ncbi:MAG: hypothetical protein J5I92_09435 [Thiogranum sp.]|nr:hypothetical protein [Thiogranum sp.]
MHQQINLYQPVFRKQQKVFSAVTLAQIAGAVLVMLLAILGHARWTLAGMDDAAQSMQQRHDHLRKQISALDELLRTPDTAGLDADIEQLSQSIAQRKSLLARFGQLSFKRRNGFSSQFTILAEQQVRGLWLDGVTVDGEGQIEIRGTTLDAKLVPVYLQQLEAHPQLSGSSFETVSMTRADPAQPHIQFVLRNHKGTGSWPSR